MDDSLQKLYATVAQEMISIAGPEFEVATLKIKAGDDWLQLQLFVERAAGAAAESLVADSDLLDDALEDLRQALAAKSASGEPFTWAEFTLDNDRALKIRVGYDPV